MFSRRPLLGNQYIVVYVWFSEMDGGECVGHAALQTPRNFVSLWPGKSSEKKTGLSQLFEHRDEVLLLSLDETIRREGRPADYVCYLYSLDIIDIDRKHDEICNNLGNWTVLGNTKFLRPNENVSMSCSSMVYDLLIAGGIRVLTNSGFGTINFMPSPHNILTLTRSAKQIELERHPETRGFDIENGHVFNPHNEVHTMAIVQAGRQCVIS